MTRRPLWAALRRSLRPVKRLVIGPGALALDALLRCSARRLGVVIVYHRVGDPPGDPHTQLVPALGSDLFRAQLALLRRRYAIVPAAELLAAASARMRFQRFPVALTFDDDWSGHVRVSMGLLAEAGVAATFFLNGSSLERPRELWFEVLQEAYDRGALGPPAAIHAEAARIQELPSAQRRATIAQLRERLCGTRDADADPGLRAEDVRRLVSAGHEIAFHTREHETLTTLADAELERALRDGRSELEAAAGASLSAIAYPAGRADARVVERARAAGFSRGYSTVAQAVAPQSDPLHLGRVYPSSESTARLHLAIGRALAARRRDTAARQRGAAPPVTESEVDPTTSVSLTQSDALVARLPFVEGIRGLAALVVVLGHLARASGRLLGHESFFGAPWRERLVWLAWPGTEMVYLFLMISGFSLFYSEDVRRLTRAATSIGLFARRRCWRILPTYYVAFAFGVVVLAIVPAHFIRGVPVLTAEPVSTGGVIAHLGLFHNLERAWIYQGNGPLWSMAYEAQLYLLFPLLYWACKRAPAVLVCSTAIVLDLAVNHGRTAEESLPFGLLRWFALGILAASIYRQPWLRRVPARLLLAVGLSLLGLGYLRLGDVGVGVKHDLVWGAAYLLLLLAMTRVPDARANPMNARPMRWLGLRSYSLYAFHFPVLWGVFAGLAALGAGTHSLREVLLFGLGLPLSIAVAQLAFKLVEQPSLRHIRALR